SCRFTVFVESAASEMSPPSAGRAFANELYSAAHRCLHSGWIRYPFSCNRKSSSMVGRRPDIRQTESNVRSLTVSNQLHWNQTLIMIRRDDDIELAGMRPEI